MSAHVSAASSPPVSSETQPPPPWCTRSKRWLTDRQPHGFATVGFGLYSIIRNTRQPEIVFWLCSGGPGAFPCTEQHRVLLGAVSSGGGNLETWRGFMEEPKGTWARPGGEAAAGPKCLYSMSPVRCPLPCVPSQCSAAPPHCHRAGGYPSGRSQAAAQVPRHGDILEGTIYEAALSVRTPGSCGLLRSRPASGLHRTLRGVCVVRKDGRRNRPLRIQSTMSGVPQSR